MFLPIAFFKESNLFINELKFKRPKTNFLDEWFFISFSPIFASMIVTWTIFTRIVFQNHWSYCSHMEVFLHLLVCNDVCLRSATLLKKRLWHSCFPVNFAKFLRTAFLQNTSGGCFCMIYFKIYQTKFPPK